MNHKEGKAAAARIGDGYGAMPCHNPALNDAHGNRSFEKSPE
jgi:hypothetical protein